MSNTDTNNNANNDTLQSEVIESLSIADIPSTDALIPLAFLSAFYTSGNWRTSAKLRKRAQELAPDLLANGQETRVLVHRSIPEDRLDLSAPIPGAFEVLRGHSRMAAISKLVAEHGVDVLPGVAVTILSGLTPEQRSRLKMDNARTVGFSSIYDLQAAVNEMLRTGFAEKSIRRTVISTMTAQMDKHFPIDGKSPGGKEVLAAREALAKCEATIEALDIPELPEGAPEAMIKLRDAQVKLRAIEMAKRDDLRKAEEDAVLNYRKGTWDRFQAHYNAGPIADWLLYQKAEGESHPDIPAKLYGISLDLRPLGYPASSAGFIRKKLIPAIKADWAKRNPSKSFPMILSPEDREAILDGEEFRAAFLAVYKKAHEPKPGKAARNKAIGQSEMTVLAGAAKSGTMTGLLDVIRGEVKLASAEERASELAVVDSILSIVDTIRDRDPEFWENVILTRYQELRAEEEAEKAKAREAGAEALEEADKEEAASEFSEDKPAADKPKARKSRSKKGATK